MATAINHITPATSLTSEEQFQAERRQYIGGSDIYQLLEEREYGKGCRSQLAYEKLNIAPDRLVELKSGIFKRGHWFEEPIAEEYAAITGRRVRRQPMRVSREFPWAGVRMDRQILAGSGDGGFLTDITMGLEIKSFHPWAFKKMVRDKAPRGATMLQIQHLNFVAGYQASAFAGMNIMDCDLRHFDVPRDEGVIDIIKREGDIFWGQVSQGIVPSPTIKDADDPRCKICSWRKTCRGKELDEAALKAAQGSGLVQISNPALTQTLEDLDKVKMEISELEALKEGIEGEVKSILADTQAVEVDGAYRVYYKPGSTSRLDGVALKAEMPEVHKQFYRTGIPTARSLRIYPI